MGGAFLAGPAHRSPAILLSAAGRRLSSSTRSAMPYATASAAARDEVGEAELSELAKRYSAEKPQD